jgi:hypothetical protein
MMVGNVATIRPPDGLRPNQAEAASPMVCGWRPGRRLGHAYATGHEISHSRRLPLCAELAKKEVEEGASVWRQRKES